MTELVLTTYDWVPEWPRGYVRDLRVRWALEEAALPYRIQSTSFRDRGPTHLVHQPFNQVPWLEDGDISLFESGAILLHIAALSPSLMPTDRKRHAEALEWVFAALNSVEMASLPWILLNFDQQLDTPAGKRFEEFLTLRLDRMEPVLASRDWLAGTFSIADILMADVLRLVDRFDRLKDHLATKAYVARATARPAFQKAHADQIAHFEAADKAA